MDKELAAKKAREDSISKAIALVRKKEIKDLSEGLTPQLHKRQRRTLWQKLPFSSAKKK